MAAIPPSSGPPVGMGLTSVILGSVGALLFFLPILSIPLGAVGLAFGILGFLMAILGRWTSLRWSVVGIVVSGLALGIGVAIALAPYGYLQNPPPPPVWHNVPDRPYVPPPARPERCLFARAVHPASTLAPRTRLTEKRPQAATGMPNRNVPIETIPVAITIAK